jgi:predicted metalloprotease
VSDIRRVAIVVVLLLIVAACGDDDAGPIFTTTSESASTTPAPGSFPQAIVDEYMSGCTPDAGSEACRCTIDEFQQVFTLDEFIQLAETDIRTDTEVQRIIDFCSLGTTSTTIPATPTTAGDGFAPITEIDQIIDLTVRDLEAWWTVELPQSFGVVYETIADYGPYFVSRGDIPFCGGPLRAEEYELNAFYCGIEDTIQWDAEGLMIPLFEEFGDFTVALVLAHEWAHAIQARFGFDDFSNPTIVSELQADCLAGAWTARIDNGESDLLRLEPGDLEEAMAGFLLIGDQIGTAPGGPTAHGGSFDRLTAFFDGFNDGVARCATYEDVDPEVVFIPLQPTDDPTDGGDLDYEDTAPFLIDALEVFWALAYPTLTGDEWTPVTSAIPYRPSSSDFPDCGGVTLEPAFYAGNAFYCPADDFVAWDDEGLFPALYTEIGDFAIGLVLANEWGRAAQVRAGLPIDTPEAQVQVDCLAGVWTAAMIPGDNPMGIFLSAGDLEEGIAGFLQLSAIPGEDGAGAVGAFDRFEAFKDGFFDGAAACDFP